MTHRTRIITLTTAVLLLLVGLVFVGTQSAEALTEKRRCERAGEDAGICVSLFKRAQADGTGYVIERVEVYSYGDESSLEKCPMIHYNVSLVNGNGVEQWYRTGDLCQGDRNDTFDTEVRAATTWQFHVTAKIYDNFGADATVSWYESVAGCNPCAV